MGAPEVEDAAGGATAAVLRVSEATKDPTTNAAVCYEKAGAKLI
jgi:hypothetical protein